MLYWQKSHYDVVEDPKNDLSHIAPICKYTLDTTLFQNYENWMKNVIMTLSLVSFLRFGILWMGKSNK